MPQEGPHHAVTGSTVSNGESVGEQVAAETLRVLLWSLLLLTGVTAGLGVATGNLRVAGISVSAFGGLSVLLAGLPRWGPGLVGRLCAVWYVLLVLSSAATGRGLLDAVLVLLPAGAFAGVLLARRSHASLLAFRPDAAAHEAQRELEARNESLTLINELAHRLHRDLEIPGIANETVDLLIRHSQPPMVAFYLLDEDRDELRLVADHGFTQQERELGGVLPVEGSLSGVAVRKQDLVFSDDLGADVRSETLIRTTLASRGVRSALSIPLAFGGRAFGTVNLVYGHTRRFSAIDLDTFRAIGQTVALAISNARQIARLEFQAFHDALTRLPNRAGLHRQFPHLAAGLSDGVFAVTLLDLNRFREINDALGHHVADRLLVEIGERLQAWARGNHAELFRLGGDEFSLILRGLARGHSKAAEALAHGVLASLKEPFEVAGMAVEIGASIGVALFPEHGSDSHELLRCADVAMYQAKKAAGGVALYARELDQNTPERLALLAELGVAIRAGQLTLHFQPKLSLRTGQVVGHEALVRWHHPTRGLFLPSEFLPLAEASELIHPLTDWVLEKALEQLLVWQVDRPALTMAVNLSARNLLDQNCPQRLEEIIRRVGVDPGRVVVELTETAVMTDPVAAQTMLGRIIATGARLAIDDFGTGYSSLAYLKQFPVHGIKIDRSFVKDLPTGEQSRAIVRSTVELAHNLGLTVVAEGIEDREAAQVLREMGCDLAQGDYFFPPAPADEAGRFLGAESLGRSCP